MGKRSVWSVAILAAMLLGGCLVKTNGAMPDGNQPTQPAPPEPVEPAPPEGEEGGEDVGDHDVPSAPSPDDQERDELGCDPPVTYEPHGFADANERDLLHGTVGTVGHVIDGDTLDVLYDGLAWRIRLLGIDSPECSKEARLVHGNRRFRCVEDGEHDWHGYESYCQAVALASGQEVRVTCDGVEPGEPCTTDVHGRWLAYIELPDGRDFGEEMLAAGAGWSFTRYESSKRASYCLAEDAAIEANVGMWSIGREAVLERMSRSNSNWYGNRDARCARAAEEAR